jgi:hypothetical protein
MVAVTQIKLIKEMTTHDISKETIYSEAKISDRNYLNSTKEQSIKFKQNSSLGPTLAMHDMCKFKIKMKYRAAHIQCRMQIESD